MTQTTREKNSQSLQVEATNTANDRGIFFPEDTIIRPMTREELATFPPTIDAGIIIGERYAVTKKTKEEVGFPYGCFPWRGVRLPPNASAHPSLADAVAHAANSFPVKART
jgi:hypothetical protein